MLFCPIVRGLSEGLPSKHQHAVVQQQESPLQSSVAAALSAFTIFSTLVHLLSFLSLSLSCGDDDVRVCEGRASKGVVRLCGGEVWWCEVMVHCGVVLQTKSICAYKGREGDLVWHDEVWYRLVLQVKCSKHLGTETVAIILTLMLPGLADAHGRSDMLGMCGGVATGVRVVSEGGATGLEIGVKVAAESGRSN